MTTTAVWQRCCATSARKYLQVMPVANVMYAAVAAPRRFSMAKAFEDWLFEVIDTMPDKRFALSEIDRMMPRFADEAARHIRSLVKAGKLQVTDGLLGKC